MKKALAGVLAVALAGCMAGAAVAQVPNIQVYFDTALNETQSPCGQQGVPFDLHVVMNNWNMNVSGVDFSISYPPQLIWLADNLVDPDTQQAIGNSPTGIAIATANCCPFNGFESTEVLRPLMLWGPCDCQNGPYPLVVGGYTPLGKTQPSAVKREDFSEHSGLGMTSLICPGPIATEATTWGQVKALYR